MSLWVKEKELRIVQLLNSLLSFNLVLTKFLLTYNFLFLPLFLHSLNRFNLNLIQFFLVWLINLLISFYILRAASSFSKTQHTIEDLK